MRASTFRVAILAIAASAVVATNYTNECYGQCNFMDTLPPCGQPATAFKDSNGYFLNTNQQGELAYHEIPVNSDMEVASRLFVVTDGTYGSLALLYPGGWIIVDAPPTVVMITGSFVARTPNDWCDYGPGSCGQYANPSLPTLFSVLLEIAPEGLPITHLIYTHAHKDHILGAFRVKEEFPEVVIIGSRNAKKQIKAALAVFDNDNPVGGALPKRVPPKVTFQKNVQIVLKKSGKVVTRVDKAPMEFSFEHEMLFDIRNIKDIGHSNSDVFIYAPNFKTLMAVDVIFPKYSPFLHFAATENRGGFLAAPDMILAEDMPWSDFETIYTGHAVPGDRADVEMHKLYFDHIYTAMRAVFFRGPPQMSPEVVNFCDSWDPFVYMYESWSTQCEEIVLMSGPGYTINPFDQQNLVTGDGPTWPETLGSVQSTLKTHCFQMAFALWVGR